MIWNGHSNYRYCFVLFRHALPDQLWDVLSLIMVPIGHWFDKISMTKWFWFLVNLTCQFGNSGIHVVVQGELIQYLKTSVVAQPNANHNLCTLVQIVEFSSGMCLSCSVSPPERNTFHTHQACSSGICRGYGFTPATGTSRPFFCWSTVIIRHGFVWKQALAHSSTGWSSFSWDLGR